MGAPSRGADEIGQHTVEIFWKGRYEPVLKNLSNSSWESAVVTYHYRKLAVLAYLQKEMVQWTRDIYGNADQQ